MGQYSIIKYLKIADVVTLLSLLSGFAAIIYFSHGNFFNGSLALVAAAFFDWIDGKAARALGGGAGLGRALFFPVLVSFESPPAFLFSSLVPTCFSFFSGGFFPAASLQGLGRFN